MHAQQIFGFPSHDDRFVVAHDGALVQSTDRFAATANALDTGRRKTAARSTAFEPIGGVSTQTSRRFVLAPVL